MAFTEVSLSDMGSNSFNVNCDIFSCRYFFEISCGALTAFIVMLSVIGMMGVAGWLKFILNAATFNSFLMLSALTIAHCVHIMSTKNPNAPWEKS